MEIPSALIERARLDFQRAEVAERRAEDALEAAREERLRLSHFLEQCERYQAGSVRTEGRLPTPSHTTALVEAAIEVITEAGPMHITGLHDVLVARGLRIGGQKPKSNLAGFLSRGSASGANIEYAEGTGWRLKDGVAEARRVFGKVSPSPTPESISSVIPTPSPRVPPAPPHSEEVPPPPRAAFRSAPSWDAPKANDQTDDDDIPF